MSLSEIRLPNAKNLPINTFYAYSMDSKTSSFDDLKITGTLEVDGTTDMKGNLTLQNDGPVLQINNNATNTNRATLILAGRLGLIPQIKFQQDDTGAGIIENFAPSTISLITHSAQNIFLAPDTTGRSVIGNATFAGTAVGSNITISGNFTSSGGSVITPSVVINGGSNLNAFTTSGVITPVVQIGGSSVGITYGFQNGLYSKIGNIIYFSIRVGVTSIGALSAGDPVTITGLPFTATTTSNDSCCFTCEWTHVTFPALYTSIGAQAGGTFFTPFFNSNAVASGRVQMTGAAFATTTNEIRISGFYLSTV